MTLPGSSAQGSSREFEYGPAYTGHSAQSDFSAGYPGHPGYRAAGVADDTRAGRPGPPANVGWAVASIIFLWPLAFVAMTRALDVYPLWAAGRYAEAEAASATAKKLGMISLVIVAALIMLCVVFLFVMIGVAASAGY